MRVRAQDSSGDMTFGGGSSNFLVNSPQAVLQLVVTALRLFQGEWFRDKTAGMPWKQQVIGSSTRSLYDSAIQACIRNVQGVTGIASYTSSLDPVTRALTVSALIQTAYGEAVLSTTLFATPITTGFGIGGFGQTTIPGS